MISIARQHGVPRSKILGKLLHTRYEPAGMTKSREIGQATSVTDYLAKWLDLRFNDGALTKGELQREE
jgi:ribonucleoside-diphosphate reductase alpha chain